MTDPLPVYLRDFAAALTRQQDEAVTAALRTARELGVGLRVTTHPIRYDNLVAAAIRFTAAFEQTIEYTPDVPPGTVEYRQGATETAKAINERKWTRP